jgi:hypothetical protein
MGDKKTNVPMMSKLDKSVGMSAGRLAMGMRTIEPFYKKVPVNPFLPTAVSNCFGVAWIAAARSFSKLFTSDCKLFTSDSRAFSLEFVVVLKVLSVFIDAVLVAVYVATALMVAVLVLS